MAIHSLKEMASAAAGINHLIAYRSQPPDGLFMKCSHFPHEYGVLGCHGQSSGQSDPSGQASA